MSRGDGIARVDGGFVACGCRVEGWASRYGMERLCRSTAQSSILKLKHVGSRQMDMQF